MSITSVTQFTLFTKKNYFVIKVFGMFFLGIIIILTYIMLF
jgi:hypothetical protein